MRFTKHIHVLHLLTTIPAPEFVGYTNRSMTPEQAADAWDHLFTYIHEHWAKPMSASGFGAVTSVQLGEAVDCRAMLSMKHDELVAKLESLPPYFREEIFPVAVARYLLRDMRIPMNHRNATTFSEFHNRYGYMILRS